VRAFVPNPLMCFRCQAHGHVAAVCRRETPRCEKCAGGHGTKECVVLVEKNVVSIVGVFMLLGIRCARCQRNGLRLPGSEKNRRCYMMRQWRE
jgi:hypothetical protein